MADIIAKLGEITGPENVRTGADAGRPTPMWETHQPCEARVVVRPRSTVDLAAVMKLCHERGQPVVPYGGLTNLVQACATTADDIVVSFENMADIEETDPTALTMIAQAGVTMRQAQEAAQAQGLFFPVDIGARDACEVGGFVSTNAGGTKVIRYGMTRDCVLGLEAVLADGTVISSMNRYIKNNSGFDLKQLFIGSEGVLGIITRVVFRLSVQPLTHNVALVAATQFDEVVRLLGSMQQLLGTSLTGFEVMWDSFYSKATKPAGRQDSPFEDTYPIYVIVESMGINRRGDDDQFMAALSSAMEDDLIVDAVIAKSDKERNAIWAIRGEVEWLVTSAQNFDVSLRSNDVAAYVDDINRGILAELPAAEIAAFGHLGDNNLHISVLAHSDRDDAVAVVERNIYECLRPYQGAVSAEHGIGLEKRAWLPISRSEEEIALMRSLKATMDPKNILNPGKVLG